ncbi:hypothetical protein ACHFCA_28010 [Delftia tsuruhatensis]
MRQRTAVRLHRGGRDRHGGQRHGLGLAADAAVGTAKIVGKGVGKAVDAMSDDGAAADNSGITVRYRTPDGQPLTP